MILRLKELRTEKNFTQKRIAELLQISQQTYSDYEKGRTNPDIATLILMSDILETTIDYLLGRENDFGNIVIKNETPVPQISAEEKQLLENFRALPDDLKRRAKNYLKSLSDAARQESLSLFQK